MALARTEGIGGMRRALALLFSSVLVASVAFVDAQWTWAGFPFLTPPSPPSLPGSDVVYMPVLPPVDGARSSTMRVAQGDGGVEVETTTELPSGQLRIWQSTHDDATVVIAVGAVTPADTYRGALATWQIARTADGRRDVVSARIGRTLVVISSTAALEELLWIADSLRETRAGALIF